MSFAQLCRCHIVALASSFADPPFPLESVDRFSNHSKVSESQTNSLKLQLHSTAIIGWIERRHQHQHSRASRLFVQTESPRVTSRERFRCLLQRDKSTKNPRPTCQLPFCVWSIHPTISRRRRATRDARIDIFTNLAAVALSTSIVLPCTDCATGENGRSRQLKIRQDGSKSTWFVPRAATSTPAARL